MGRLREVAQTEESGWRLSQRTAQPSPGLAVGVAKSLSKFAVGFQRAWRLAAKLLAVATRDCWRV